MPSALITGSGTWALPANVTQVTINVIGGGGGGGRGNTSGGGAGGGGGGSAANTYVGSPGDVLTITVGAGGVGTGASGTPAGSAGGDTFVQNPSLTDICHATGGALGLNKTAGAAGGVGTIGANPSNLYTGGKGGDGLAGGNGGSGGSAADSSVAANGNNGSTGAGALGGASPGGNAGAGGNAGNTATSSPNGKDGAAYGGGGGGGDENGGGSAGGNGLGGVVYITWSSPAVVPRGPLVFRPRQSLVWATPIPLAVTHVLAPRLMVVSAGTQADTIVDSGVPQSIILRAPVRTVPYPRPVITTAEPLPETGLAYLLRTTKATAVAVIPPPRPLIVSPEQRLEEGSGIVLHAPQPLHLPVWPTRVITTFLNEEWPASFPVMFRPLLVNSGAVFDHCLSAFDLALTVPVAGAPGLTVPVASGVQLTVPVASSPTLCNG